MNSKNNNLLGFVHSIESLGTLDGPGIRTVVFLQGCPLKCKFCHNIDCGTPEKGPTISIEELSKKVLKDEPYWQSYDHSGNIKGGITISGGESTFQASFTQAFLLKMKEKKVHTAIDSCLLTTPEIINKLIPHTDLWMVSIKHTDEKSHHQLTGSSNKTILRNLEYLDQQITKKKLNSKIRVRFLIIPGKTDSEKNIIETGKITQNLKNLESLELLAYGDHGKHKWIELFGSYPLEGTQNATQKDLIRAKTILKQFNFKIIGV